MTLKRTEKQHNTGIKKKGRIAQYAKHKYLVAMMALPVLFYLMFCYYPMLGVQIAFREYNFIDGIWGSKWVGLEVFENVFKTKSFFQVLKKLV